MATEKVTQNVMLGSEAHPVRFSYINFHTANKKGFFGGMFMVPKADKGAKALLDGAMRAAAANSKETKGEDFDTLDLVLRDGDDPKEYKKKGDHIKGHWFFNAKSKNKPEVVGKKKDPVTGKKLRLEQSQIKSGDYGVVAIRFYGYANDGKVGVAAALNGAVLKLLDGDPLGGNIDADSAFETYGDDEEGQDPFR